MSAIDPRSAATVTTLDHIRKCLNDTQDLLGQEIEALIPEESFYLESDSERLKLMLYLNAHKTLEHLRSIQILTENSQDRDALVIARILLESATQVNAARADPNVTLEWFWFGVVEDWRQLSRSDRPTATTDVEKAKALLNEHGKNFYSAAAKRNQKAGKSLPEDPYRHAWSNASAKSLMDRADFPDLYESVYANASAWIHGSARALHLPLSGETPSYTIGCANTSALAMVTGTWCAQFVLSTLHDIFGLDIYFELENLKLEFRTAMNNSIVWNH